MPIEKKWRQSVKLILSIVEFGYDTLQPFIVNNGVGSFYESFRQSHRSGRNILLKGEKE
jgi:hypothetical protein